MQPHSLRQLKTYLTSSSRFSRGANLFFADVNFFHQLLFLLLFLNLFSLVISKAISQDVVKLEALINSAYRGESSKKGWTTEADLLAGLRTDAELLKQMMSKPNAVILKVCEAGNEIAGCVYLEKKVDKLYVGLLTVSPTQQARGIGKKLLTAAEQQAGKLNCSAIQMTVISVRSELIKWYERHGYHKTGETQPFPADEKFGIQKQPLEFIVMEKGV